MALEQHFREVVARHDDTIGEDEACIEKLKPGLDNTGGRENSPPSGGGFDCNICLDLVHEPVVTLCGHLYCWPCIYKWIDFQSDSVENPDQPQPQCPVCKAEVSQGTLVPLYCPGHTAKKTSEARAPHLGVVVPRRPPSPTCATTTRSRPSLQLHNRTYPRRSPPMLSLGGTTATPTITDMFHPMVGEMVLARILGNSETTLYAYPNSSYNLAGISSPRMRRHVMEADKSLGRVCFFLCCCILLCLLLF